MKMKKATENQAQPANASHKLVDKSHFLAKLKKNVSAWFRQSVENSTVKVNARYLFGVLNKHRSSKRKYLNFKLCLKHLKCFLDTWVTDIAVTLASWEWKRTMTFSVIALARVRVIICRTSTESQELGQLVFLLKGPGIIPQCAHKPICKDAQTINIQVVFQISGSPSSPLFHFIPIEFKGFFLSFLALLFCVFLFPSSNLTKTGHLFVIPD